MHNPSPGQGDLPRGAGLFMKGRREKGMWNSLSRGKSALISTIVYTLLAGIFTWATVVDYNEAEFYRENIGFAIAPIAVTLLVVVAFLIHKKHYSVIKEKRWLSRLFTAIFMILHLTNLVLNAYLYYLADRFFVQGLLNS